MLVTQQTYFTSVEALASEEELQDCLLKMSQSGFKDTTGITRQMSPAGRSEAMLSVNDVLSSGAYLVRRIMTFTPTPMHIHAHTNHR